jgi:hypothetical protein
VRLAPNLLYQSIQPRERMHRHAMLLKHLGCPAPIFFLIRPKLRNNNQPKIPIRRLLILRQQLSFYRMNARPIENL